MVRARGAALMGVLNVTPDSFFDGGRHESPSAACARVDELLAEGADLIDIGGESSRPGSEPVPPAEQLRRIEPAVRHALSRPDTVVSIDTTSPEVADRMLVLGARVVNDVSCLADDDLARVTARRGGVLILMHSRGPMSAMPGFSSTPDAAYHDVVAEVLTEWARAKARAVAAGMPSQDVWLDPGLGFAKNARQSLELLARTDELVRAGAPVVIGPSRKSFIAAVDASTPAERLGGSIAACLLAVQRGAWVVRVHDVREVRQALAVSRAASHDPAREVARAG